MQGVTCSLLTPWWRRRGGVAARDSTGGVAPTRILDWHDTAVSALLRDLPPSADPLTMLRAAHAAIGATVRPVYALDDRQPVSKTLRRRRGSCSQRLAILEAVARAAGLPTRVQGLLVDGRFWYPRFRRLRRLVPDVVVLAWPEFRVDGEWMPVSELFGAPSGTACFTNASGETLFEALSRGGVDWSCDLSGFVVADLGRFDSRDELFAEQGQTMCRPALVLAEPLLNRWSAGAVT